MRWGSWAEEWVGEGQHRDDHDHHDTLMATSHIIHAFALSVIDGASMFLSIIYTKLGWGFVNEGSIN